jgi:hypothetical protein
LLLTTAPALRATDAMLLLIMAIMMMIASEMQEAPMIGVL